jgi:NTE family protein
MDSRSGRDQECILVLQGGGALGAYQAGVFETLSESGHRPEWVAGTAADTAAAGAANEGGEEGAAEDAQSSRKKPARLPHKAPSRKPAARSRRPAKPKTPPENG